MSDLDKVTICFKGFIFKNAPVETILHKAKDNNEIKELLEFIRLCVRKKIVLPDNLSVTLTKSKFHKSFIPEFLYATVLKFDFDSEILSATERFIVELKIIWR